MSVLSELMQRRQTHVARQGVRRHRLRSWRIVGSWILLAAVLVGIVQYHGLLTDMFSRLLLWVHRLLQSAYHEIFPPES